MHKHGMEEKTLLRHGEESDYAVIVKNEFELLKKLSKKLFQEKNLEGYLATIVQD